MHNKVSWMVVIMALSTIMAQSQLPYRDVISRYRTFLLAKEVSPVDSIKLWCVSIQEDGKWADINYNDATSSGWKATEHLKRVVEISRAYQKESSLFYKKDEAWTIIKKATEHWIALKYQNPNWWYNEIGVPQFWRDIIALNSLSYTDQQLKSSLSILSQFRLKENFTGANLTWSADLALHYGLFTEDEALVQKASKLLANEIKISKGEGIRPDFSYHQHGARLQTHHYGAAFFQENVRLAYELYQSPWAFSESKINILKDFAIEGWQWMARGVFISPATIDRAISRNNFLKQDLSTLLPYLIQLYPGSKSDALNVMLSDQQKGTLHLSGFKYFPYSDFGSWQSPDFSFFLKKLSTRTEVTERINNENQKGTFLNLGNTYFLRNGKEYTNLMPVWDWRQLPGITNFKGATTIKRHAYAGGVSSGSNGLMVMDFETYNDQSSLTASKFWALHNGKMFCLIANIELKGNADSIFTVLEQSRLQGDVILNSPKNILKQDIIQLTDANWINHNGFTYVPLTKGTLSLSKNKVKGAWSDLTKSGSTVAVTERVFKLVQKHQKSSSAYMVDGITSPSQIDQVLKSPEWKILRNDSRCQAIYFNDGITMVSFREKGELSFAKHKLSANRACLAIVENNEILLSDPLQIGGEVEVGWLGKIIKLQLPKDGSAIKHKI
ncbi:MAG: chondroitin AC lyase [Pedobacter sp.]|nr:MAG: chondroitin AC lyase [Pedobacter sp.]